MMEHIKLIQYQPGPVPRSCPGVIEGYADLFGMYGAASLRRSVGRNLDLVRTSVFQTSHTSYSDSESNA